MGPVVLELDEEPVGLEHGSWLAVAVVVLAAVWQLVPGQVLVLVQLPLARYPPAVRMVVWLLDERSLMRRRPMLMRLFERRKRFSLETKHFAMTRPSSSMDYKILPDPKSSFSSDESSTVSTEVFTTFEPVETDAPREPDETALLRDPLEPLEVDGPSG